MATTGWRMARVVSRASVFMAFCAPSTDRASTSVSGNVSCVTLSPIQEAKDSLSHKSSHQAMVTRSPNHMCAISCAVTSISRRRWATLAPAGSIRRI